MFFVLPYKFDRRFDTMPWVTITLIAVNVLVYAATFFNIEQVAMALGFRANAYGVLTWFTAMFLHGSLMHLLGNMYFLWLFGSLVEDAIGWLRYLALYFIGGAGAAALHALVVLTITPDESWRLAIGASGAVAAVIGIVAVRMYKANMSVFWFIMIWLFPRFGVWKVSALAGVALYLLQEVAWGVLGFVVDDGTAHWAHVGGLLVGLGLGLSWGSLKVAATEYLAEEAKGFAVTGVASVAVDKYAELVEKDPGNPEWLVQKVQAGMVLDNSDPVSLAADLDKAIALMSRAGDKAGIVDAYRLYAEGPYFRLPLSPQTLQTVGSMAESQLDFDVADAAYRDTITRYPSSREAERSLFRLAHVFLHRGMEPQAQQTWGVFTKRYPSSEWHAYADSQLERVTSSA